MSAAIIITLVTLQRIGELWLARRNTRALRAAGGVEFAAAHYPMLVALHALWLASLWAADWDSGWTLPIHKAWLALFLALQFLRIWVFATLRQRWTTRIIVLPGEPRVRTGPYRFMAHPNYAVVIGEIATLPLAFGLVWHAVLFSFFNAALLSIRIAAENEALAAFNRDP